MIRGGSPGAEPAARVPWIVLTPRVMIRPAVRHLVPLLLLAVAVAGCGDDSTDGAGGGDAYSEDPVLGTEHDGACETVSAFTAQRPPAWQVS